MKTSIVLLFLAGCTNTYSTVKINDDAGSKDSIPSDASIEDAGDEIWTTSTPSYCIRTDAALDCPNALSQEWECFIPIDGSVLLDGPAIEGMGKLASFDAGIAYYCWQPAPQ